MLSRAWISISATTAAVTTTQIKPAYGFPIEMQTVEWEITQNNYNNKSACRPVGERWQTKKKQREERRRTQIERKRVRKFQQTKKKGKSKRWCEISPNDRPDICHLWNDVICTKINNVTTRYLVLYIVHICLTVNKAKLIRSAKSVLYDSLFFSSIHILHSHNKKKLACVVFICFSFWNLHVCA